METEKRNPLEQLSLDNPVVSFAVRMKFLVAPILVGLLVAGLGFLAGNLTGAVMVAWGVVIAAFSTLGICALLLVKFAERQVR